MKIFGFFLLIFDSTNPLSIGTKPTKIIEASVHLSIDTDESDQKGGSYTEVQINEALGLNLFEGDIILSDEIQQRNVVKDLSRRWPK